MDTGRIFSFHEDKSDTYQTSYNRVFPPTIGTLFSLGDVEYIVLERKDNLIIGALVTNLNCKTRTVKYHKQARTTLIKRGNMWINKWDEIKAKWE